jgi:hypothetical protein
MAETLVVQITGKDGVSKTFQAVERSAKSVGEAVEQPGKQGEQGFRRVGASAEQAASRMESLKQNATAIGAVMGVLGSAVIATGSAFRDQQRQISGITAVYGEQSEAILQTTEDLQNYTRYSNDAARESALLASSLVTNYGMSAESVSLLIERSADLAQIYGVSLPDAVQRTSAALRGEGEGAERLSLNLSDAAVAARALDAGITNWNVPGALSEAEKSAFRFQLFLQDTEATAGQAAAAADNAGGSFRRFANEAQDAAQAIGGFLGPAGQIAAEMAPLAVAAPVVGAGIGRMTTAMRGSTLAASALGVGFNPVTLGIGAVVAGGVLLYNQLTSVGEVTRQLEEDLASLGETLESLKLSGETATAARLQTTIAELEAIQAIIETSNLPDMNELLGTAFESALDFDTAAVRDDLQRVVDMTEDVTRQITNNLSQLTTEQQDIYLDWVNGLLESAVTTAEDSNLDDILEEILIRPASEVPGVMEDAAASVTALANAVIPFNEALLGSEDALERLDQAFADNAARQQEWIASFMQVAVLDDPLSQMALAEGARDFDAAMSDSMRTIYEWGGLLESSGDSALQMANDVADANAALETTFRVIVGNTNALGQQTQGVADWADELIGAVGTWSELDNLLNEGRISLEEYNNAQSAQAAIAAVNAIAQESVLAIQAKQAPLIADMTIAQAGYLNVLADMPAAQQLVALGWMDSATAARAMEISTLAAAAAAGELGVNGEAAFTSMVTGAAQADPVLKALLVDMGLISEGADGTITVNLDGAEAAISDLDLVNTHLTNLIDLLDNGLLDKSYQIEVGADTTQAEADIVALGDGTGGAPYTVPVAADTSQAQADIDGLVTGISDALTVPVEADTSTIAGAIEVAASGISAIQVPVELDFSGIGGAAASGATGFAEAALGQAWQSLDIKVGADTSDADAAISGLQERVSALAATSSDISVSVTGSELAIGLLTAVGNAAEDIPETENISVTTNTILAIQDLTNVTTTAKAIPETENVSVITNTILAIQSLNNVTSAARTIPESESVSVSVIGAAAAIGQLHAVANAANSIPASRSTTITTNVVTAYSTVGRPAPSPFRRRHGGMIPGYAHGGVLFEAGEAGPEIAHFAGGGMAHLPTHGFYEGPPNTYISPANASTGNGGLTLNVNVNGPVFGIADLTEQVMREMGPALEAASRQHARSMGAT